MAYIGLQPQRKTVATSTQRINGNGVDYEYSLNRGVSKAADISVYVGTAAQVPEVDYTATGTQLLFSNIPAAGTDNITVNYLAGALTTISLSANSYPQGTTVLPSIRYVDSTSTGMWFPSTTSIGLTVSGNTRVTVSDSPTAVDTSSGAMHVDGGVGIVQNLIVGGDVSFVSYSTSSDSTSGALVVNGGMGIGENLNVNGSLNVAGDFIVAGQFTTTGADSLVINDPFLFLANANPGDALDTGFVSSYNDTFSTRYSGLFRDVTDGQYKLFYNLEPQPSTTVNTAHASYVSANLVVGNLIATNLYGNILGSSTIDTLGNLTSLSVAGTTSTYNIVYVYNSTDSSSTSTGALQVKGGVGVVGNVNATGVVATNLTGTLQTAAQTNVTSLGNLASVSTSGTISAIGQVRANAGISSTSTTTGALTVAGGVGITGQLNVGGANNAFTGNIVPSANVTYNLGSTTAWWSTAFVTANQAKYADLAENYLADAEYAPGTVLHFGGEQEVTLCDTDMCSRIAGVVSTAPGYLMNATAEGEHVVAIALQGRVPCRVQGTVAKGDMMVSAGNGHARAESNPRVGSVIGKALENFDGPEGLIEVVVGRV